MHEDEFKLRRDNHPAISIYWIAEDVERGRPVVLHKLSCMFCKRTIVDEFRGVIMTIINSPLSLANFGASLTVQCKQCKQKYRMILVNSYLG